MAERILYAEHDLRITRLPDGGFVVSAGGGEPYSFRPLSFAATKIDTALDYIRDKLSKPVTK